jgi:hypothetical protein
MYVSFRLIAHQSSLEEYFNLVHFIYDNASQHVLLGFHDYASSGSEADSLKADGFSFKVSIRLLRSREIASFSTWNCCPHVDFG